MLISLTRSPSVAKANANVYGPPGGSAVEEAMRRPSSKEMGVMMTFGSIRCDCHPSADLSLAGERLAVVVDDGAVREHGRQRVGVVRVVRGDEILDRLGESDGAHVLLSRGSTSSTEPPQPRASH
jgi:hypothetical protein